MPGVSNDGWATLYKWEWFRREAWLSGFPHLSDYGRRSLSAIAGMVGKDGRILDCSCGFGHKTVALRQLGVEAHGSDGCGFAVEKAREIAASRGLEIPFFASGWAELPERVKHRFDAVFNDALCWQLTEQEFAASLLGIREVLVPGGRLVFSGARQGEAAGRGVELMAEAEAGKPKFRIEWAHEADGVSCTSLVVRELASKAVHVHHLYLVRDGGKPRLETATICEPSFWDWPVLEALFAKAGYSSLRTVLFKEFGKDGAPLALNIAIR
jgi:SAM-dependent methyltransferase